MIYYSNNGTMQDSAHAVNVGWIGPSVTPLTNLNSGYRMYEVDTGDFSIYDAYTYYANVSAFQTLNAAETGPVWNFEYSTRDTYPIGWPADAPLNATYWQRVTEAMATNHTLVSIQNTLQGKMSVMTPNCTSNACAAAKICYMRSGNVALGRSCPQGSVLHNIEIKLQLLTLVSQLRLRSERLHWKELLRYSHIRGRCNECLWLLQAEASQRDQTSRGHPEEQVQPTQSADIYYPVANATSFLSFYSFASSR